MKPGRRDPAAQSRVLELRRSNAAQAIPAKKIRRAGTRQALKQTALKEWS